MNRIGSILFIIFLFQKSLFGMQITQEMNPVLLTDAEADIFRKAFKYKFLSDQSDLAFALDQEETAEYQRLTTFQSTDDLRVVPSMPLLDEDQWKENSLITVLIRRYQLSTELVENTLKHVFFCNKEILAVIKKNEQFRLRTMHMPSPARKLDEYMCRALGFEFQLLLKVGVNQKEATNCLQRVYRIAAKRWEELRQFYQKMSVLKLD